MTEPVGIPTGTTKFEVTNESEKLFLTPDRFRSGGEILVGLEFPQGRSHEEEILT